MAFTQSTLGVIVQPIGSDGMRFISYRTDDDQATVTATDYFADAGQYGIRTNDLIFVSPVTASFDPYILVVDTVDAEGNVTATIGDDEMLASIYDPQGIAADAFARANHTGTQTLSTISDAGTAAAGDIGADVQAWSANLDAWSALATSAKQDSDSNLGILSSGTTTLGAIGLALLEDETAADAAESLASVIIRPVADRTALKALSTAAFSAAYLKESGREGVFVWRSGDFSTEIAADTQEGVYIKADAIAATSGAWVRAFSSPVSVKWFGATGDGSTDDSTAIQVAINVASGAGVFFPAGDYLATGLTVSDDETRLFGESWKSVILQNGNVGTVLSITGTDTQVYNLKFSAASQRTGGKFIDISAPIVLISNCHLRMGFEGIDIVGSSSIVTVDACVFQNFDNNDTASVITVDTTGADITISECVFDNNASLQPIAGINVRQVQDITISGCNIIHCGDDLLVDPDTGSTVASLWATNTFFDTAGTGVNITDVNGGNIVRCRFEACWASSHTATGMILSGSGGGTVAGISIIDCHMISNGGSGLSIGSGVDDVAVHAGFYAGNSTSGISLEASASSVDIVGAVSGAVAGVSGNAFGIFVDSSCTDIRLLNNNCAGNTTSQISHGSPSGSGNRSIGNVGYNDTAAGAAVSVGASPFTHTAADRPETIYIEGGTVSGIEQAGVTMFTGTGKTVALEPGESVTITYSSTPFVNQIKH